MIDQLHNTPDGARVVTYEPDDAEFELMAQAFARKGLDPEAWRYVFSAVGGRSAAQVEHFFARQNGDLWVKITEPEVSE